MAGIGSLVAFLSVNSKKWNQGFAKASQSADKFGSNYKRTAGKVNKQSSALGKQFSLMQTTMLAAFGGVALLGAIGGTIGKINEFAKSSSKLQAILGVSKKEMGGLTEQAKKLGSTTAFTASEVVELQTELAKLGFTSTQIEQSTAAILDLAAASGSELAQAATVAGATVRGFGLAASDTQMVVDVMAKSFSSSALDMEKFQIAMSKVAPVAKNAGADVQTTSALLGILSNNGLEASTAGTSLRNIFLELANKGLTFNDAMTMVNGSTNKNKTAMDLFGKKSATAAAIIASSADEVDNLTDSLENSAGAAKKMADVMLDNLTGDITKAQSAWEGFVLSLDDGSSIMSKAFRGAVQEGTKMLNILSSKDVSFLEAVASLSQPTIAAMQTLKVEALAAADAMKSLGSARNKESLGNLTNQVLKMQQALADGMISQKQFAEFQERANKAMKASNKAAIDAARAAENLAKGTELEEKAARELAIALEEENRQLQAIEKATKKAAAAAKKLADEMLAFAKKKITLDPLADAAKRLEDNLKKATKQAEDLRKVVIGALGGIPERDFSIKIKPPPKADIEDNAVTFWDKLKAQDWGKIGQKFAKVAGAILANVFGQLPVAPGQAVATAEAGLATAEAGGDESQIAAAQATLDQAQVAAQEAGELATQSGQAFSTAMDFASGNVAGGISGLVSIFGESSEAFQRIITMVNETIGVVMEKLAPIFEALLEAVEPIIDVLLALLVPLTDLFLGILEPLLPIIKVFGELIAALLTPLQPLIEVLTTILVPVFKVLGFVLGLVAKVIVAVVNVIIGIVNAFKKSDKKIDKVASPKLPQLAAGGIVTSPTIAEIGEGGKPEAIIPLDRLGEFGGGGTLTSRVAGEDLVFVLDRVNTRRGVNG